MRLELELEGKKKRRLLRLLRLLRMLRLLRLLRLLVARHSPSHTSTHPFAPQPLHSFTPSHLPSSLQPSPHSLLPFTHFSILSFHSFHPSIHSPLSFLFSSFYFPFHSLSPSPLPSSFLSLTLSLSFLHSLTFGIHSLTPFFSSLTFFRHFCFTETTINTETTTLSLVTQLPVTFSSPLLHHHHNYCCTDWLLLITTFGWPSVHSFFFHFSLAFYSFFSANMLFSSFLPLIISVHHHHCCCCCSCCCCLHIRLFFLLLLFCSSFAAAAFAQQQQQQSPRSTVHGPASVHCPV